ncbi:MAG: hypothetical protein MUQ85_05265 [Flavobacteriaceae bacterium]|jgi:RimJ/RimL family protein N-acetyltransferase|nr:hypothetical protein [Flavobacteriaceae bacterium]MDO7616084.1 hypothetical protein [Flavobacteriaceae bacterium]MDO7702690.1 hypothetical protein [Flavobacteriaceae bacterium]
MKFDFSQAIKLENDRVLLRPLEQKDFENLLLFSENEKILWRYSLTPASGEDNLHKYIELFKFNSNRQSTNDYLCS